MLNLSPFLAIPYKHGGRDYNGADCWQFIRIFYRDVKGVDIPDVFEEYDVNWSVKGKNSFFENYYKLFNKLEKPELYSIVIFQNKQGITNHGGITLGYGKFIHCCKDGVLVDNYKKPAWQKRINGFYQWQGLKKT